jgi:hypothetical protein
VGCYGRGVPHPDEQQHLGPHWPSTKDQLLGSVYSLPYIGDCSYYV